MTSNGSEMAELTFKSAGVSTSGGASIPWVGRSTGHRAQLDQENQNCCVERMTRALTVADAVARLQIQHRLASNPRVDAGHGAAAADAADIRLVASAVALAWQDAAPGARGRAVLYGLFDSRRTIRLQKQRLRASWLLRQQ